MEKRKQFSQTHKSWCGPEDIKKWHNILWSNETKINLFINDTRRNGKSPKRNLAHVTQKRRRKIKIGGCFSLNVVGAIHLISEIMAKEVYKSIIEEVMLTFASEEMSSFNNIITLNNTPG